MAHPIIFLDVDGVLNSCRWFRVRGKPTTKGPLGVHDLDPHAVRRLNRIIDRTGARVVVSSVWRLTRSVAQLQEVLEARGFRGNVVGKTPQFGRFRGHEIQAWLFDHPEIGRFVIIDDDCDMAHLMPRLVCTHFRVGLTNTHVDRAVAILKGRR